MRVVQSALCCGTRINEGGPKCTMSHTGKHFSVIYEAEVDEFLVHFSLT